MQFDPAVKLLGEAPVFLEALRQIAETAHVDAPVLIEGETGTGKELAARAMHYSGCRAEKPFIPVNCGALPESLIENELFGHCRGAYTDAREPQPGLVAQADGGTLFLDEIDALPYRGQVALLRFLQDSRFRPLGANRDQVANVRIIAATNANLDEDVADKRFRADLLYRLRIFSLTLPALRDRGRDAFLLIRHFLGIYSRQYKVPPLAISDEDSRRIAAYSWPGNVRELENLVHRAVVQSRGKDTLCLALPEPCRSSSISPCPSLAPVPAMELGFNRAKAAAIETFERNYIERALLRAGGNVSAAARLTGKERRAFGKLMKKYGVGKQQFVEPR